MSTLRLCLAVLLMAGYLQPAHAQEPASAASSAHSQQWEQLPPWVVLKKGMTTHLVALTLGEPTETKQGRTLNWFYSNPSTGQTGSLTFKDGVLYSWGSPRFTTPDGATNTKWKKPGPWAGLVKGLSQEQVRKAIGNATWVSIGNGNWSWFYYDTDTGSNGSMTFHAQGLFSWNAPTFSAP